MKIAYIGKIQLSDVDLSYLHEAQKLADVTYIMEVTPRFMKGPAYNLQQVYGKSGVFKATEVYPEFEKYGKLIDLDKFYVVNTCGRLWQLKAIWTNLLLLWFLVRNSFEVIHLTWPPNLYEMSIYFLSRKLLLTVHDPFPHSGLDTFIVRLRRKMAFFFVKRFVILNKTQRQEFLDYYHLQPQQVFDSRLSSYDYLHIVEPDFSHVPSKSSYILFAGKISPYKGVDYLLPAITRVHQTCPDVKLIVAGGGKYHFDIEPYMRLDYIDIRNRFIPDEELVALIKNAAFMVCPYTDATQSGVIMSAYVFHTPVIATRVGALPEMVDDGRTGILIKNKDVDAIAEAVTKLWDDKSLQSRMADNIADLYAGGANSWHSIAESLLKVYDEYRR